ncbi:DUF6376 family protein [Neobacillus drentensis]|uniref:DUF6376 family protein n=1 Tax=Neobacillus drentensis TaxID=220684 RepID=UPI002FFFD68F
MKKSIMILFTSFLLLLTGCSLLNDAKNTVTYINEATSYLDKATAFANEAPSLAQQAVGNQEAAKQLETMLKQMKQEIQSFNQLQAPDIAVDLHQQIIDQNNKLLDGINLYLNNFKNGLLDPSALQNTELFQTVQDITSIINQIKQLGQ